MAGFLKINGRINREESILDLAEAAAPTNTAGVGKYYASSVDNRPHFVSSDNTDYDLTVGTPAGSDTQIQFNDGGSTFGADSDFVWDKTNHFLGIGVTPDRSLTIEGDDGAHGSISITRSEDATGASTVQLKRSRGTNAAKTDLAVNDVIGSIDSQGYINGGFDSTGHTGFIVAGTHTTYLSADWFVSLQNSSNSYTERMRLTSTGYLGLGTSSPTDALTVTSDNGANAATVTVHRAGVTGGPYLRMKRSRGTYDTPLAVSNNDALGIITFQGHDGSSYGTGAAINVVADEDWDGASHGTRLNFQVTSNGSLSATTRLRLESEGSLWIDQISVPSVTTDKLYNVGGSLYWDGDRLPSGVRVDNIDVDQPSEVIDSFADTTCSACYWHYVMSNGTNYRSGLINACWNATTNVVQYRRISTDDIGDTSDVVLSVDISGDNVRLIATVASDNWSVRTKRFFIDD